MPDRLPSGPRQTPATHANGLATPWVYHLYRWAIIALGVALAASTSKGIEYADGATLALAAACIALLNVFIKPILVLFALPFVILTLGLGMLVINALLFMLAGAVIPNFEVSTFGSALWGALVVAVVGVLANTFVVSSSVQLHQGQSKKTGGSAQPPGSGKDNDVIDI